MEGGWWISPPYSVQKRLLCTLYGISPNDVIACYILFLLLPLAGEEKEEEVLKAWVEEKGEEKEGLPNRLDEPPIPSPGYLNK